MKPEIFAEWLRCQGHYVTQTKNSYWFEQGPRVFQAFPYHWIIQPSEDELIEFLKTEKAIGLRYSTSVNSDEGKLSYHAVYDNPSYGFENLGKWACKNVRRGLKQCIVEQISFERLAEEGWVLQLDTFNRQGRQPDIEKKDWVTRCTAAGDLSGFEAWGAFVGSQLAASVITFQMQDCAYMLYQQCHRDFLVEHVNNALSFVVTQALVKRPLVKSILYGLHSLDAPPSVDEFKFRMGYKAKPVRQRVVFTPRLKPIFNAASHAALCMLLRIQPSNHSLAKAEGMLRFYLEGKKTLEKQSWPPPLMTNKAIIEAGQNTF